MTNYATSFLVGAAALLAAGSVHAAPLMPTAPVAGEGMENVRMVCNEWGRCWQTRGPRYHYGDSYNAYNDYGPRYRPYRRHYGHGPGVQFNAPGVHFGIGVGPNW